MNGMIVIRLIGQSKIINMALSRNYRLCFLSLYFYYRILSRLDKNYKRKYSFYCRLKLAIAKWTFRKKGSKKRLVNLLMSFKR